MSTWFWLGLPFMVSSIGLLLYFGLTRQLSEALLSLVFLLTALYVMFNDKLTDRFNWVLFGSILALSFAARRVRSRPPRG
jgi:hypothetical protein